MRCEVGQRCQNSRSLTSSVDICIRGIRLDGSFITLTKHQPGLLPGRHHHEVDRNKVLVADVQRQAQDQKRPHLQPRPLLPPPLLLFE